MPDSFVPVQLHLILHCYLLPVVIRYLSLDICYLACCFIFPFVHSAQLFQIRFCLLFVLFHPIIQYSITQFFFFLILEMCSSYFDPHNYNHPASQ
jgi:hypothetical protein